ncbi:MAG: efflux RND transporter permease subunit [Pseudomonadota bacterium]
MKLFAALLDRHRLILTVAAMLALTGLALWLSMVRQEDPRLPDYWGLVIAPFPGADATTVERLVLQPIEDALVEVDAVKQIEATAFDEMAVMTVELRGDTKNFTKAWDDVREALARARTEFPSGAGEPMLDENQQDQDSVVLAVTGSSDRLRLLYGARRMKDALLRIPAVSKVHLVADPGEQVTIKLDDAAARRVGLSPAALAAQLAARNRIIPGGSIELGGKAVRLRPLSEFAAVDEIANTPIALAGGKSMALDEVADVRIGSVEPIAARMRVNGDISVGLAVVPKKAVNLVDFGASVRQVLADAAPSVSPLKVDIVTFQPSRTAARIDDLSRSLATGMLVVAGVLVTTMGLRLGLLVAAVVPLVTLSSLAIFAWGGGVLHQISIAAFVLALGMLVDNAIVVAENIQWRLDRGEAARPAAVGAITELAIPLAGATATTLAAFVPMLISQGPTAAFTRSIPVIMMLTLTVSYGFAMLVTPVLARMSLKGRPPASGASVERLGAWLARVALNHSTLVAVAAVALVLGSVAAAGRVDKQFFPAADRNQLVVDIKLAEGAHLDATDHAARILEEALLAREDVTRVASFMGRSAPKFYYNIHRVPYSPHFAQLIVETRQTADIDPVVRAVGELARERLPGVEVVPRKLEQGPPVQAPVEVRLFGDRFEDLHAAAVSVSEALAQIPGTRDVRQDLGPGVPTIRFAMDDAAAARYGLSRADVARTLYGRTRGLPVGELYIGEDPVPVVVRSSAGERLEAASLETIDVQTPDGRLIPLSQVARLISAWSPAAIKHRDGRRVVTVSSQLSGGIPFNQVLAALEPKLKAIDIPKGIVVAFGGEAEGSGEANTALMTSLPIGMLLLVGVLLAEFNSFKLVALVLMTVPLSAAGVVPGLLIGNQPFGFMSLLGVFALIGIVVNNAIVLLEVIEERRRQGAALEEAVTDAVSRRIRPILLTTGTTVAGLLPLAFSSSTLWPPLASAMISGLLASTMLTLVVLPAAYRIVFGRKTSDAPATETSGRALISSAIPPQNSPDRS